METYRLLVVEDDADINALLRRILEKEGFLVDSAYSGSEARMCLDGNKYDLVLLDLMLPGMTGEELIQYLRGNHHTLPIIVLSAKSALEDRVSALKIGADDYIVKPFDVGEVIARVQAQLRRSKQFAVEAHEGRLTFKALELDAQTMQVYVSGQPISLTAREFAILKLLMSYPKKVFTRANLFETVWNDTFLGDDNTINVHISNIRAKIAKVDPDEPYIKTVWGIGFKMAEE